MDETPLAADQVHLWYARPDVVDDAQVAAACEHVLSPDETERWGRLRQAKDRTLFLVAHALVRGVLSQYAAVAPAEWRFVASVGGKPEIAGPAAGSALRFNLSHTRDLAAVAVTRGHEIGVDVESLDRRVSDDLVRSVLAPSERARLDHQPAASWSATFFEFWTLKESYLKARGVGLGIELQDLAFDLHPGRPPRVTFAGSLRDVDVSDGWQFRQDVGLARHRAAVAVRCPARQPLTLHVFEADLGVMLVD